MLKLSKEFQLHQMAIVVNGVVIVAPRLNGAIGNQMMIAGNFSDDDRRQYPRSVGHAW